MKSTFDVDGGTFVKDKEKKYLFTFFSFYAVVKIKMPELYGRRRKAVRPDINVML